jgi:hypothetical protein
MYVCMDVCILLYSRMYTLTEYVTQCIHKYIYIKDTLYIHYNLLRRRLKLFELIAIVARRLSFFQAVRLLACKRAKSSIELLYM